MVFFFGWLAYAFTALLSIVSGEQLMPVTPDVPVVVASTEFGHGRSNQSWIPGRLMRFFEKFWMPVVVKQYLTHILAQAGRPKAGMCISVIETSGDDCVTGVSKRDWWWYSKYMVAIYRWRLG